MPEISLPAAGVAELDDFLRFLADWLTADHDQVADSLAQFMDGHPYCVETLRHDLVRFKSMLGGDSGITFLCRPARDIGAPGAGVRNAPP